MDEGMCCDTVTACDVATLLALGTITDDTVATGDEDAEIEDSTNANRTSICASMTAVEYKPKPRDDWWSMLSIMALVESRSTCAAISRSAVRIETRDRIASSRWCFSSGIVTLIDGVKVDGMHIPFPLPDPPMSH